MQTSYAFIAAYKQQINALDRQIQSNARQQQQQQQQSAQQQRQPAPGPVEHRKLLQRFRQFLAEEEKFWTKLIVRLHRTFALSEARPALEALGIPLDEDQSVLTGAAANTGPVGRNQLQFPPEESTPAVEAKTPAEREMRMSTLSKALVCLGDIARYRELYNESGGRPRAGHEDGAPARRRNRRAPLGGTWVDNVPKARNYDKAQQCYEQARILVPHEGNPSHQLAILASYKKDAYASLFHYYRALCVKQPYDTALNNMGTLLGKTLEQWRLENKRDKNKNAPPEASLHPKFKVEKFKERLVTLHALWRVGSEKGFEKMNSLSRKLDKVVAQDFAALVGQRQMPTDMITQAIVMSQGALWKHRMLRDTSGEQQRSGSSGSAVILEWYIVKHILDMHYTLLEVGKDELNVPPSHDTKDDLGQQITATFRRTLPALRAASKWLRANAKYLSQDPEFSAYQQKKGAATAKSPKTISKHSTSTKRFWEMFAEFSRTLARTFPLGRLPKLTAPLEEDTDLRGFLPLKKLMDNVPIDDEGKIQPREEVHPNEEQLMRIADLLGDARDIAELEYAPVQYYSKSGIVMLDINAFEVETPIIKGEVVLPRTNGKTVSRQQEAAPSRVIQLEEGIKERDDSLSDVTSPDDDEDVVRDAFSHLDTANQAEEEDIEEDQIVFDPRPAVSPIIAAAVSPAQTSPMSPVRTMLPPVAGITTSPRSPPRTSGSSSKSVAPTTAEDLLNNVMGRGRSAGPLPAPQPPLLFRSEPSHRPNQSIWSTSQDEQRLMAGAAGHVSGSPLFQSPTHQYLSLAAPGPPPELSTMSQQSIWGATPAYLTGGFENTQQSMHGTISNGVSSIGTGSMFGQQYGQFSPANANGVNGSLGTLLQHKRIPSLTQHMQFQQQLQNPPPLPLSASGSQGLSMNTESLVSPLNNTNGSAIDNFAMGSAASNTFYNSNYQAGPYQYHSRHLSYNDPRMGQTVAQPSPQLWGNT
ncbi:hypothetical protein AX17_001673 [Amanita inopinata Kibby_2008]|nr:hypothetical protein AX17_001673 [Amanita inopinata Kibby_2008]